MALPLVTVVVGAPADGGADCRVKSFAGSREGMMAQFGIQKTEPGEPAWANYFMVSLRCS